MKPTTLFVLLIVSNLSFAQNNYPLKEDGKTVEYSDIFEVTATKDVLFKNAKVWVAKNFQDYKAVIQFDDKESGKIIIKGISKIDAYRNDHLRYVVTIDCKDNKYRCVISDLELHGRVLNSYDKISNFNNILAQSSKKELVDTQALISRTTDKKELKKLETDLKSKTLMADATDGENALVNLKMNNLLASLREEMQKKEDF